MKLGRINGTGNPAHWCPGCKMVHVIDVSAANPHTGARWTFDGNWDRPTFSPSVKIMWEFRDKPKICHYFIRAGRIQYCGDSTHALAGQTIDLPEVPDDWMDAFEGAA